MDRLAIGNSDIARRANHGHRLRQSLCACFLGHRRDIDRVQLVRARHDPDTVCRRAAIELCHSIIAMRTLIPIGTVPMGDAVAMPGDGRTATGLLDKNRFVKGVKSSPLIEAATPSKSG